MSSDLLRLLRGRNPVPFTDAFRACVGAVFAIGAIAGLTRLAGAHTGLHIPLLAPSVGASAVLVFAIPASPLAQPRAVLCGNILSALIGVACAILIPNPLLAGALSVGVSMLAMSTLGCLHPPGGGIALGATLAAPAAGLAAYGHLLESVALCSVLLVAAAALYINLTGRSYPHRAPATAPVNLHNTQDRPPAERVGFTPADLDGALAQYGELLDVSREDLEVLFRKVEMRAHQRIHSRIPCADIMSRDVITVDVDQTAESALAFLRQHDLRAAPVIDGQRRVVGMVRRAELQAGRGRLVEAVLDPFVHKVRPSTAIEALLPLLSSGQAHEAMVVDDNRVLLGVITQTDLLAVLYRAHIVEAAVGA